MLGSKSLSKKGVATQTDGSSIYFFQIPPTAAGQNHLHACGCSQVTPPTDSHCLKEDNAEYLVRVVGNISFTPPRRLSQVSEKAIGSSLASRPDGEQPAAPAICSLSPHSKKQIMVDFFSPYCRWGEFNNSSQISSSLHSGM